MDKNILFELQNWLDEVKIPSNTVNRRSFLSIGGLDHYENIWSNMYAFFLTPNEEHGLEDIFLKGLYKVLKERGKIIPSFKKPIIEREISTFEDNRIDLLIREADNSFAIIIENKVYHSLKNDLDDYWNSISTDKDKKIGIVLSLFPIETNNENFINLTHLEWINSISDIIKVEKFDISTDIRVFLLDFFNTVKKHSMDVSLNIREFYNSNRLKVNELAKIATDSKKWFKRLFLDETFARKYGFEIVHTDRATADNRYVMYKFPDTDEFVVTVFYEDLWNSNPGKANLRLFLETQGKWFKRIREKNKENDIISFLKKYNDYPSNSSFPHPYQHKNFWHLVILDIPITEEELLDNRYIRTKLHDNLRDDSQLMILAHKLIELIKS